MPKFTGRYRMSFPRASTISGAVAVAILVIAATPASAQDARKLSKDELADFQTVHALVDAVASGKQPAPADAKVTFRPHFLKSGTDIYVPYTVDLEPGKLTATPLVMYVRAVSKAA